jgi:hypothetical protein
MRIHLGMGAATVLVALAMSGCGNEPRSGVPDLGTAGMTDAQAESSSATMSEDADASAGSVGTTTNDVGTTTDHAGATTDDTGTAIDDTGSASTTDSEPVNLLVNPSLEDWADADVVNTYPDGWTECDGGALGFEAVPDVCAEALPITAADGARYARGYADERLGQIIATEPGQTYTVELSFTQVEQCFGGTPDSGWEVVVDGVVLATTPSDQGIDAWSNLSVDFVATAATADVCFRKAGGTGGIDALSVVAN